MPRQFQTTLTSGSAPITRRATPNLPPTGDELITKNRDIIRIAYHNIRGVTTTRGLCVPDEIEAMEDLAVDVMGMSETNRPWTPQNRETYDYMMNLRFSNSRTVYSSAPTPDRSLRYQPGGNLLTVNGRTTGRITSQGSDPLGRFCWYTFRGHRDEGVIVITAYRVCHDITDNPGPHTAFSQQYMALRAKGVKRPNPRLQIFTDLTSLISHHRAKGFRPIVMLDANGDYLVKDTAFQNFLTTSHICDPFYEKFRFSPSTNINGSTRLDYILMDRALCHAVSRIGYLGTHDGAMSDHVVGYVDFHEQALFAGIINRPLPLHSREILIEQDDKVHDFLTALYPILDSHNFDARVFRLAKTFATTGATASATASYQTIYGQLLEIVKGVASKVGRKKYGYMRSPELGLRGRTLIAYKKVLDCCVRSAPFTPSLTRLLENLQLSPPTLSSLTERQLRVLVRKQRQELWECQKHGEDLRQDWLSDVARQRAQAAGDPDWEKRLRRMIRRTRESALNRKLTAITKGRRGVLDRIQVPTHLWFFSGKLHELYHYDNGVFESFPHSHEDLFHTHHTIKILPPDAILANVSLTTSGWRLTSTSPIPVGLWKDITSQSDIESILLARNQRHLEQVQRQGGQSTLAPISDLREGYGFNPLSASILAGEATTYDLTPEMTAFFSTLKRTPSERILPPVLGVITSEELQAMFTKTRERTSSDSRTLNYSIWKCLSRCDRIARFLSVLFSLPFTYGFANLHWSHMTDYMLEKKPGVRQIHTLRIIGKVAAEFNTCLKFFIGKQARDNFERTVPCDDQHGFRPHRSSIDAAMLKLLTFECARMQKATVGTFQNDMTGHFDRMWPELTSVFASKFGVSQTVMECIGKTIHLLERNVETALGVSQAYYSQATSTSRIGGMVQGKADVPQLSTQQMDIMLKTHRQLAPGLLLRSPTLQRSINRSSISYADDTDGQVSADTTDSLCITDVVENLRRNAQTWSTIADICGGLIALHKCNWHLLTWEMKSGHLSLRRSTNESLVMTDCHGSPSAIPFLHPDQPNVGLGFHICPSGSQLPQYSHTYAGVLKLCHSVASAHLAESEMHLLLRQRLLPKLSYALHGSSFTAVQCSRLNSILRSTFLPGMRLNRHFPAAVLYGPMDYGGLVFPEVSTLQDQVQLDYLLKQLRWDKVVANDFLVTLDATQLCSGLSDPILEAVAITIDYLEPSYIIDLRRRLAEMGASIWIEDAWVPCLQREGDSSLMDCFSQIRGITRAKLRRANAVRLYIRVFSVADIADIPGTHIRDGMLQGDWQAGSDLLWPYQPKPPKVFWACFRWCLRQTICRGELPNQPAHYSMRLDKPLGRWLPVTRNTWYTAYRSPTTLYWRRLNDETLHILTPSATSGFYHVTGTTSTLPIDSHPIVFQQVGESIWTRSPFRPGSTPTDGIHPPGHMVENTLCHPTRDVITLGSDGSVHLAQQVAACAWMIHDTDLNFAKACFLLSDISSMSSYRSELEGIFRSLKHVEYLNLTPSEIHQFCDNEAAVDQCSHPPWKPGAMLQADADVLLAIHAIRRSFQTKGTTITCRHIYAHQDTRSPRSPGVFEPTDSSGMTHTPHDASISPPTDDFDVLSDMFTAHDDVDLTAHTTIPATQYTTPRPGIPPIVHPTLDHRILSTHSQDLTLSADSNPSSDFAGGLSTQAPPRPRPRRVFDTPTMINIECDRLATETTTAALQGGRGTDLPPTITCPLPGSKANLRIGQTWITSHTRRNIHWEHTAYVLRAYCLEKYGWSDDTFNSIAWSTIKTVRARCTHTQQMSTSKIMHDWLPVMHMMSHMSGNAQCPGCLCPDETLNHIFRCPHPQMVSTRVTILSNLRKQGRKRHAPRPYIDALTTILTDHFDSTTSPTPSLPPLRRAVEAQRLVGDDMFLRGFIVKDWATAISELGGERPHVMVAWTLRFIWFECTTVLWHTRNGILHNNSNQHSLLDSKRMDNTLQWFLDHQSSLALRDQYLLRYSSNNIPLMPVRTKRELTRLLEISRAAHSQESQSREPGQTALTDFFTPLAIPRA